VRKILFVFLFFILPFSSIAQSAAIPDTNNFFENSVLVKNQLKKISIDTTLNRLEIYDPASIQNFFGLGFPGAASFPIVFNPINSYTINPFFNSFSPFLLTTSTHTSFNLKRPVTQIEYVIFPSIKTEQYLDLLHSRNINRNINIGVKMRKLKSNGYFLNQGANISNLLAFVDAKSKNSRYHIYSNFVYNNLVSIENGGIINDTIDYTSRSIALQSLPVNLNSSKNKVTLYGGKIAQYFDFGSNLITMIDSSTSITTFIPSSQIGLSLDYSNHRTSYFDSNPTGGFYENVYTDSEVTYDKYSLESFLSEVSFRTLDKKKGGEPRFIVSKMGLTNSFYSFEKREEIKTFTNTSAFVSASTSNISLNRIGFNARYFLEGYNKNNYAINFILGRKFLDSTKYEFIVDMIASIENSAPDFVYQNFSSNHFKWKNEFQSSTNSSAILRITSKNLVNLSFKLMNMDNYIFMDSLSTPSQNLGKINYFSTSFNKLFNMGQFYLNSTLVYQSILSGRDVIRVPDWFTRNSIYWGNSVFKKAMDLQIGFDVVYTSKFQGMAYQPSINTFYLQNAKYVGNYPGVDFFVNFKIRQARVFFKVDHLNYGMTGGKYAYVPGYLLPGRTYRFGLSWLFDN
jgi:Putative porin